MAGERPAPRDPNIPTDDTRVPSSPLRPRLATIETAGAVLGAMGLEESVRKGNRIDIPSLGISIGAEHLSDPPPLDNEVGLGTAERVIEGDNYVGRFSGKAWITGDGETGFLSDTTLEEYQVAVRQYDDAQETDPNAPRPERKELHIEDLFPTEWSMNDAQVEYEITVKAKRVQPRPPVIDDQPQSTPDTSEK